MKKKHLPKNHTVAARRLRVAKQEARVAADRVRAVERKIRDLGGVVIPQGFERLSFPAMVERFGSRIPRMKEDMLQRVMPDPDAAGAAVARMEAEGKLAFAASPTDEPSVFGAPASMLTEEERRYTDALCSYFDTTGQYDPVTGAAPPMFYNSGPAASALLSSAGHVGQVGMYPRSQDTGFPRVTFAPTAPAVAAGTGLADDEMSEILLADGYERISVPHYADTTSVEMRQLAERAGLSLRVVVEIMLRFERAGCLAVFRRTHRKPGELDVVRLRVKDASTLTRSEALVAHEFQRSMKAQTGQSHLGGDQSPAHIHATYTHAVNMQLLALQELEKATRTAAAKGLKLFDNLSVEELWGQDIENLKRADTFCWWAEPMHAVSVAADSLPRATKLQRGLTPTACGWWWFTEPLPVRTTNDHEHMVAVLWWWSLQDGIPGIVFSCYVQGGDAPIPTTRAFWPETYTVDQFLGIMQASYDRRYTDTFKDDLLLSRDTTLKTIDFLGRFFTSGCLWMQQRILVTTPGHVERHERKRMEKAGMTRPADIQVIQLRRRASTPHEPVPEGLTEKQAREWTCRWVVNGHWRQQPYRTTGEVRPVFIEPYMKGPDDKPLRVRPRVYAVTR